MAKVADVLNVLAEIAPHRWALPGDKVGLQVGDAEAPLAKAVVSLDRSLGAVAFAEEQGAQLLLSHHPLLYTPLASVTPHDHVGRTVTRLVQSRIAFIASHTNWDAAPNGVNDALVALFGLTAARPFGECALVRFSKLVWTVPASQVDQTVDAAAAQGAGVIGLYQRCAYQQTGNGVFEPTAGAHPSIGEVGRRASVDEVRVEMKVRADLQGRAVEAVRAAHPYEEPVIDLYDLCEEREAPLGRVGQLPAAMTLGQLARTADEVLKTRTLAWGDPNKVITRLAVVGGSADGEWVSAQHEGADALITGEVRQHVAVEASESDFGILSCGHFATEHPGACALAEAMRHHLPEVEWTVYTPEPGLNGRPF